MTDSTENTPNASPSGAQNESSTPIESETVFLQDKIESIKAYAARIESIKNLLKDAKYIVAFEKIQGVGDGLAFLMGTFINRIDAISNSNESDKNS